MKVKPGHTCNHHVVAALMNVILQDSYTKVRDLGGGGPHATWDAAARADRPKATGFEPLSPPGEPSGLQNLLHIMKDQASQS